jgi:hypothetical protein
MEAGMEGERIDVAVEFTVQQLELVDQLAEEWSTSREVTVRRAVEETIANLREGDGILESRPLPAPGAKGWK